jgi:hypothetical protein
MTNKINQLTAESRRILVCWSRGLTTGTCADREAAASEALRMIDAQAAERAALVAVIARVRAELRNRGGACVSALALEIALAGAGAPANDSKSNLHGSVWHTYDQGVKRAERAEQLDREIEQLEKERAKL